MWGRPGRRSSSSQVWCAGDSQTSVVICNAWNLFFADEPICFLLSAYKTVMDVWLSRDCPTPTKAEYKVWPENVYMRAGAPRSPQDGHAPELS